MPRPTGGRRDWRRSGRLAVAMVLIAVATWAVVVEPFAAGPEAKGRVLLSITPNHGIDTSDLPAIALYLVAVGLIGSWMGGLRS